jgi:hypothetical protein
VVGLAAELATAERARLLLADHYVGGTDLRFPNTRDALAALGEWVDALLAVATAGARRGERVGPAEVERRARAGAPDLAAGVADRVRAQALDLLGHPLEGAAIIAGRLRAGADADIPGVAGVRDE